ncbi:DUF2500 domain-containing protein [Dryocola sp. BD613]|uniref:DUF2500 domain-containing protein n=1 Tax=Dryocola sp. BD613 TaxID=3133272 RepID=UPI003F4FA79A
MSKPPVFFIAIIVLIVVAASFRFMQQRRQTAENDAAPLSQKSVIVAVKRETPANDRRSRQREVVPAGSSMRYEVRFRPQAGGMEMKMRVSAEVYHELSVGDKGTLQYKGTRFIAFVPQAPH